jgi:hypothetical protein
LPSECSNSSSDSTFTFSKAFWSFMFPFKLQVKMIRIFRKACNSSFSFSARLDMLVKPKKKEGIPRRIRFEFYSHIFQKMNTMVANCFWTAQNYTQNRTTKCQFCPWSPQIPSDGLFYRAFGLGLVDAQWLVVECAIVGLAMT